ncbi:MAG: YheC/YheD family protein [Bacillota bacterium]
MTLIGMLHHRKDPILVRKAYAFAAVAKAEGIDFFYFTPGKVDVEKRIILGKAYEKGKWIERRYPYPDVIYNASPPVNDKKAEVVHELSKNIPFTSHSVGDKLTVYNKVIKAQQFTQYLIPTSKLISFKVLLDMAERYIKVIVKPLSGHKGAGIFFVEKMGEKYNLSKDDQNYIFSKNQLIAFIENQINQDTYLVQKFITCNTKSGNVYDFRLHVQKDGDGRWVITAIYPRIGKDGSIASNLGNGGYTCFPEIFLKQEFGDNYYNIQKYLEQFALKFSNHFESLYEDVLFDELGIDVGLDEEKKIWLFEVNWRPGPPIIFNIELDVVRNTIQYARYLAIKSKV